MNRLVSVTDRDGEITAYTYDANGNRSTLTYPNGNKTAYTYDNCNRLTSLIISDLYSNVIERYDYTLGTAGERLSVQETNRTVNYTYDALYRLTQETIQDGALDLTIDYTYDAVGNRLTQTDLTGTTFYTYNALNQLILENDTVYTYDDNGALIAVTGPDRSAEYTYNDLGRMSTATVTANGTTITESYLYDWVGTRTAKITDGVLTYYLVDTAGVLSDTDGQVTDTYIYDAFGNLLSKTGTTENDFLYTGEQYDINTGFYYLRARYMNPATGTFTSMDAYAGTIFDPVSLHKYLYANANPVMNRDPSGYLTVGDLLGGMAIQAIIGAAFGSLTSSLMSMLFYDTHGGDMQSPERIQVAWEGFWKGALLGAAGGAFFGGLAILGTEFILANVMSGLCFYFMSLSAFGQAARFYMDGDILWGDIFLASAGICFIFSGFYFGKAWSMAFDDFYVPASVGKAGAADDTAGVAAKGTSKTIQGLGSKTEGYIAKRGWTMDTMNKVVGKPYTTREAFNKATGNAATAYYNKAGDYVVVDNVTGELVQTSKFGDPGWIPDATINNPYKP